MNREVSWTPEEILTKAKEVMVGSGTWILNESPTSVTFEGQQGLSTTDTAIGVGMALFNFEAATTANITSVLAARRVLTILATPTDTGCTVIYPQLPPSASTVHNTLHSWFVDSVLREDLPNPFFELMDGSHTFKVHNNRLSYFTQGWTRGSTGMEERLIQEVHSASVEGRKLTVQLTDGAEWSVKADTPQTAERVRKLIEARKEVHATTPV